MTGHGPVISYLKDYIMDDSIRDAVKFISDELRDNPTADRLKLIDEASKRFDLNPLQEEFLTSRFLTESKESR